MKNIPCEKKDCKNPVTKGQADRSLGETGHVLCPVHLHIRIRLRGVIHTIFRYLKNGQSLNDVVETTDITRAECMEALDVIEGALKKK